MKSVRPIVKLTLVAVIGLIVWSPAWWPRLSTLRDAEVVTGSALGEESTAATRSVGTVSRPTTTLIADGSTDDATSTDGSSASGSSIPEPSIPEPSTPEPSTSEPSTSAVSKTDVPTTAAPSTTASSRPDPTGATDTTSTAETPSDAQPSIADVTVPGTDHLGSGRPVTLAFGGDVHFEGFLAGRLAQETMTLLEPVAAMMADADLAMVNLETAVTDRGVPAPKAYTFRTTPAAFVALRAAGVDVVSLANNHGLDFGQDGLTDTIDAAAAADFPIVGIGADASEAYRPWVTEIRGQRIAVIGATQVLDNSLIAAWTASDTQAGLASAKEVDRLVAEVAAVRPQVDTLVVYLHWGIEGQRCPAPRQQSLADALVAAGADIIIGGHAHRVQSGGRKQGAVVHYGLGNFVFYTASGPGTETGVLRVTATGRRIDAYEWVPARLRNGVATQVTGDEGATQVAAWDALRDCTDLRR